PSLRRRSSNAVESKNLGPAQSRAIASTRVARGTNRCGRMLGGGLAHCDEYFSKIGLEIAAVGNSWLWFHVDADLDVLVLELQPIEETLEHPQPAFGLPTDLRHPIQGNQ